MTWRDRRARYIRTRPRCCGFWNLVIAHAWKFPQAYGAFLVMSCEASSPTKITSWLGCLVRRSSASIARSRYHCCSCAFFGYATTVLAVNIDQRPVLFLSSRSRHNALFLSSFSCSLIAVELHCDAWCSHEVLVHSTLQPLCGSVRVLCCRIFVIALSWVRSKFEQLQYRAGTA